MIKANMEQPNLSSNFTAPPQVTGEPTPGDVGLLLHKLSVSKGNQIGNVSDTELGDWAEYNHNLLVKRANFEPNSTNENLVSLERIVNNSITRACEQGGAIDSAIKRAINTACLQDGAINRTVTQTVTAACLQDGAINRTVTAAIDAACATGGTIYNLLDVSYRASEARAKNGTASRETDFLYELPNMLGRLPSSENIRCFPRTRGDLRSLPLVESNQLLTHYNQPPKRADKTGREEVRKYIGATPF